VRANLLTHRHGVMLMLPNREIWTFEGYDQEVTLENSAFLAAADGPRHTLQILIRGEARKNPRIAWSFVQVDPAEARSYHRSYVEPELPL
jgi:uncharacterized heparinase superfamily protein